MLICQYKTWGTILKKTPKLTQFCASPSEGGILFLFSLTITYREVHASLLLFAMFGTCHTPLRANLFSETAEHYPTKTGGAFFFVYLILPF